MKRDQQHTKSVYNYGNLESVTAVSIRHRVSLRWQANFCLLIGNFRRCIVLDVTITTVRVFLLSQHSLHAVRMAENQKAEIQNAEKRKVENCIFSCEFKSIENIYR